MKQSTLILVSLFTLTFFSCKKETKVINPTPNVTTVSFSNQVMGVFNKNNCNGAYCHGNNGVPGIAFGNYSEINAISTARLLGAIKHDTANYSAMPKFASKLAQSDINIIETWINEGKNNN